MDDELIEGPYLNVEATEGRAQLEEGIKSEFIEKCPACDRFRLFKVQVYDTTRKNKWLVECTHCRKMFEFNKTIQGEIDYV